MPEEVKKDDLIDVGEANEKATEINLDDKGEPEKTEAPKEEKIEVEEVAQPEEKKEGGEVFRSGLCYKRGNGKIFYFRPGHESYPVYYNKDVQTVIRNSVYWVCPEKTAGVWQDRIALGIDNMMRSETIEPIKIKVHQVDHNYKK